MARVDVHHHILPLEYVEGEHSYPFFPWLTYTANSSTTAWNNASTIPKGLKLPPWSPAISLDFMHRNNIGTTILSLSAPALSIIKDPLEANALCRRINEYAASIRDEHSQRFGFFATIPSPQDGDVSACISEITFALDVLKADGVTLLTSYGGRYLGHPDFRPIWRELDRRAAVVFVHPTMESLGGAIKDPYLPSPILDFPHETTRTAVHLIISRTPRSFPACKIILSHAGGTLPYLATRVAHQSAAVKLIDLSADEFLDDARGFFFDLALSAYEGPLELLLKFARPGHVLYGSDFPFAREVTSKPQLEFLERCGMSEVDDLEVRSGAALRLFPRLGVNGSMPLNGDK